VYDAPEGAEVLQKMENLLVGEARLSTTDVAAVKKLWPISANNDLASK